MFATRVSEMVGSTLPIFAFSHCRDVVAAVTNAGGCGVLGVVRKTPDELVHDLRWIEERVGSRPYGVDILLPKDFVAGGHESPGHPDPLKGETTNNFSWSGEHDAFVTRILDDNDIPALPNHLREGIWQSHVGDEIHSQLLETILEFRPKVFASALGSPNQELLDLLHGQSIVVTALAGTVEHARRHVRAGVDFVVAQGTEAGGHTGQIATMVLVPDVVDAVAPVPVVAAGGIASGRQIAAGIVLGAEGVWTGSVWLTTTEAEEDPAIKKKLIAATSADTVRSRCLTGKPARMLRSAWTDAWESPDAPKPLPLPMQRRLTAEALFRIERAAQNPESKGYDLATYFVGQVVGRMNQEKSVRQVMLEMVQEYAVVLESFVAASND